MNNVQWWKWEEHDDQFGGRVETIFSSSILMFSFLLLFSVPSFTQSASCITKWMGWKTHKERDGHTQDLDWMRRWTREMRNNREKEHRAEHKNHKHHHRRVSNFIFTESFFALTQLNNNFYKTKPRQTTKSNRQEIPAPTQLDSERKQSTIDSYWN